MTTITITLPRATVEQALEALTAHADLHGTMYLKMDAITALRAALAQQVKHVAWANIDSDRLRVDPATGNVSIGAQQAEPVEPVAKMTAHRAVYFMERFKREEKMLGPNEQAALDFVISMLEAALAQQAEMVPMPLFPPVSQWNRGCAVCRIGADGKAYGYVCPRSDCPTKITCGGVA